MTPSDAPVRRIVRVAHSLPGRVRLRLPWLRQAPEEASGLADALAAVDGVIEVKVRPWTGSLLCAYDPERLEVDRIVAAVCRAGRAIALAPDAEEDVHDVQRPGAAGSTVGRALATSAREIDREILKATEGRLDLGTVAGFGFLAAGAAEVVTTQQLPAPPWFNLAWWAFRTFTMFEKGDEPGRLPPTVDPRRRRTPGDARPGK